jgi:hypothetical protein
MKYSILVLFFLLPLVSSASIVVMSRVDARLFIHQPRTDFETIYLDKTDELKNAVAWLFAADKLSHEGTKSMNISNQFENYWNQFNGKWHFIDMDQNGQPELIFSGKPFEGDEKEMFSLYAQYGTVWKEIYWDDGHLLAYKIHPRTNEILLYHHRYPCCSQSTHSINRLRYLKNKVFQMKRYFLARDEGMKGNFFPKTSSFKKKYGELNRKTMLYWSKGKISLGASQYSPTNEIIHFAKGSHFKILAKEERWMYVQMISQPIVESSAVVNAANLKEAKLFGWILNN